MPLDKLTGLYPVLKIFRAIGTNKAIAWSDQIMNATAGTASGDSVLEAIAAKLDDGNLLSVSSNTPVPDGDSPPFHYRIDERNLRIKRRTGVGTQEDPYQYSWLGPFDLGDDQADLIYSTEDNPSEPVLTWNHETETLNFTGNTWNRNRASAKWQRIVILPSDSNTISLSHNIRVGDPTAEDISYTPPSGNGNIPSSVDNVKEGLDVFHNFTATTTAPTQTGGTALIQSQEFDNISGLLSSTNPPNNRIIQNFSINSNLRNYRTNFNAPLFIEANATIELQQAARANENLRLRFAILTSGGSATIAETETINADIDNAVIRTIRIAGNLPSSITTGGTLEVSVVSSGGATGGVTRFRLEIRPDLKSDEVVLNNHQRLGPNFETSSIETLNNALEQASNWPIQPESYYQISWPVAPNGIDSTGTAIRRTLTIPRNLRTAMDYDGFTAVGYITLTTSYITGSRTDSGVDSVTFDINIYTDVSGAAIYTDADIVQTAAAENRVIRVQLPDAATVVHIDITSDASQFDAKLLVANSEAIIGKGIDASGFTGNLDDSDTDTQALAQKVNDLVVSGAPPAVDVSVTNTQFSNPHNFGGGLRQIVPQSIRNVVPGLVNDPTNVQQAFVKTDYMLQLAYNPFEYSQDLNVGSPTFSNDFTVNTSNPNQNSDDIDVPNAVVNLDGGNLLVRVQFRVSAISNFTGTIEFIENDSNTRISGTVVHNITATAAGNYVNIDQTITDTNIEDPFRVRISRTAGTGSITLTDGIVLVTEEPAATGMTGGQSVTYNEVIIWVAGGTTTARLTNSNVQTLLAGNTWGQYQWLHFNFDNGTNDGMLFPMVVLASQFRASQNYGTFIFSDLFGYNVIPHGSGDNQFRFIWNGAGTKGLRRILGVSYS